MTLNRVLAAGASAGRACRCECGCLTRVPCYPSDLTDEQWAVLEPVLPVMLCDTELGGRPEKHHRRAMIDAILYVADNGVKWRALPADFLSVTWNQTSQDPSRILRRHRELRRPVGHEGAGGEVAGSGPA
jgi:transposase